MRPIEQVVITCFVVIGLVAVVAIFVWMFALNAGCEGTWVGTGEYKRVMMGYPPRMVRRQIMVCEVPEPHPATISFGS